MEQLSEADRELIYQMQSHFNQLNDWRENLNYETFIKDEQRVKDVAEAIARIGQVAKAVSEPFKEHFNSIAWESLADLEAAITAEDGPSADITWGMLNDDVPYLAKTIDQVASFIANVNSA